VHARDCDHAGAEGQEKAGGGKLDCIERRLFLHGPLDATQRARLHEIADKCPVHRTLTSEIRIDTTEADDE